MIEKLEYLVIKKNNHIDYLKKLSSDDDVYISNGAFSQLIDLNQVSSIDLKKLTNNNILSESLAEKIVNIYLKQGDFESIKELKVIIKKTTIQNYLNSVINNEYEGIINYQKNLFLQNFNVKNLLNAYTFSTKANLFNEAIKNLIRCLLLYPDNKNFLIILFNFLHGNDFKSEYEKLISLFKNLKISEDIVDIFDAQLNLDNKNYEFVIKKCNFLIEKNYTPLLHKKILEIKAIALEKIKKFEDAYNNFYLMNNYKDNSDILRHSFIKNIENINNLKVDSEKLITKKNLIFMTGFPRTGSTLLENILSSHPQIESYEELPYFSNLRNKLLYEFNLNENNEINTNTINKHLQIYFNSFEKKNIKDEILLIDKMPIRSVYSNFLKNFFPNQKYIFLIRNPYDVVLSCFKNNFFNNMAMAHFNTIENSMNIFVLAMNNWFSVFQLNDQNVCYIKYENLISNNREEINKILSFLSLKWSHDIHDFYKRSSVRNNNTPSYKNVRKGLSLGIQTLKSNYSFLFKKIKNEKFNYWVKKLGYELI